MSELNNNEDSIGLQLQYPEQEIKPRVSKNSVPDLVHRLYGLKVADVKELPGYDDLNFYVLADDTVENRNIESVNKNGYVLKILNSLQSSKPIFVDAQHALSKYVRERGIPTQKPVLNRHGLEWSLQTFTKNNDGDTMTNGPYIVRLMTFIPGKIFLETPFVSGSFYNIGKFAGRLNKALAGFHHSYYDNHLILWSLEQTPVLRDFLKYVAYRKDIALVENVIDEFKKHVVPKFNAFTKGIIHGDLNEQNIIVHEVPGQDSTPHDQRVHDVSAILDFGDVTDSYTVFDVAICITYLTIECPEERQVDVGGHVLAGYYETSPLNDEEFDALKILICARLCQSLVLGAHSYSQQPGNAYLLTTAKRGWPLLRKLWQIPRSKLYARWKEIMKQYV